MKTLALKAAPLSDDAFALRAIPFSGPIPSPVWPGGVDLDGETFTHRTDIKPDWFKARPVDWHHDLDPTGIVGNTPYQRFRQRQRSKIAEAVDLREEEDGWWVTVWQKAGEKRWGLIQALAERGARIFGSSEPAHDMVRVNKATGHIDVWPYVRQTLSTSPQNTHSILVPLKAALDDMLTGGHYPSDAFWQELLDSLQDLQPDLVRAKAGRSDGRALAEMLDAADAQVMRLRALYLGRADTEVPTHGGSDRL
jgi:hypothetical protein